MATVNYSWVVNLAPKDNLQVAFIGAISDTISATETTQANVNQPFDEQLIPTDDFPLLNSLSDAIFFYEDQGGIVKGPQKTIYITDERYIIRHDW